MFHANYSLTPKISTQRGLDIAHFKDCKIIYQRSKLLAEMNCFANTKFIKSEAVDRSINNEKSLQNRSTAIHNF